MSLTHHTAAMNQDDIILQEQPANHTSEQPNGGATLSEQPNGGASLTDKTTLPDASTDREEMLKDEKATVSKRCESLRGACFRFWRPIMTKHNPLPTDPSCCRRFQYGLMCPPHGRLANYVAILGCLAVGYGVLLAITGPEALPHGNLFSLFVLFALCVIGGYLITFIKLPPLLGMLLVGVLLGNIPVDEIRVAKYIDNDWSDALRSVALAVILIRAGLGLDPTALRKLSFVVFRLAFSPCLMETLAIAVASHFFLNMPWVWGFILGFVVAAVSPAVVVPCLLSLRDRGYGLDKGIPTLVIAAASIDDVLAITGFGVMLGIAFTEGNLVLTLFKGPLEALLGIVLGILMGIFTWYIPQNSNKKLVFYRSLLLFGGGLLLIFGSRSVQLPGSGPLGCLTMAFVSALRWRQEGWTDGNSPVQDIAGTLWMIFQPLLFGLIGAEVNISTMDGNTIGMAVATMTVGLIIRLCVAFLAVFRTELNWKERFFVAMAWMPKATVQAAIGATALDAARKRGNKDYEKLGLQVLTVAVLVILITAPIGAAAITLAGPKLLNRRREQLTGYDNDIESQEDHEKYKQEGGETENLKISSLSGEMIEDQTISKLSREVSDNRITPKLSGEVSDNRITPKLSGEATEEQTTPKLSGEQNLPGAGELNSVTYDNEKVNSIEITSM